MYVVGTYLWNNFTYLPVWNIQHRGQSGCFIKIPCYHKLLGLCNERVHHNERSCSSSFFQLIQKCQIGWLMHCIWGHICLLTLQTRTLHWKKWLLPAVNSTPSSTLQHLILPLQKTLLARFPVGQILGFWKWWCYLPRDSLCLHLFD